MCGRVIVQNFSLIDRYGECCGQYCSERCAVADAWGPRFKTYSVRKKGKKEKRKHKMTISEG